MSNVGGVGGTQASYQDASRTDSKGGSAFASAMKKQDDAKADAKKQDDAADGAKAADAKGRASKDGAGKTDAKGKKDQDVGDVILGRNPKTEATEGKGQPGGGGKGGGQQGKGDGGAGAKGGAQVVAEKAKGELLGKTQKSAEFSQALVQKGRQAQQVDQTNKATDAQRAEGIGKAGAVAAAKLNQKDDQKSMQSEVAKNLFQPGQTPPLFLMNQLDAPAAVTQVQKVQAAIPPEIVDKVVERARFGMNAEGAHEFQIDLKQDVYAGSQLKIATKDGKVSVNIIADNADVAASFEAKAQEIAKSLSDRGLNVQGVTVSIKEPAGGASGTPARTAARSRSGFDDAVDNGRGSGRDYSA
jgi:hypothetical protein